MISDLEIKRIARSRGVPVSTIERDLAQIWLLEDLGRSKMAFKGGTCLQKIFFPNYRFSDDLDFTMINDIGPQELAENLNIIAETASMNSGITFNFNKLQEVKNGFVGQFEFRLVWSGGSPTKVKIDLTGPENEMILVEPEIRRVVHDYEDVPRPEVLTYDVAEIFAEKIRSLFQRTRPRDLYDVSYMIDIAYQQDLTSILRQKFDFKNIEMDLDDLRDREDIFRSSWNNSLRHQLASLPSFDLTFPRVYAHLQEYENKMK